MARGTDAFVGAVLAGTYRVVRLIGRGGMGAIYEASHVRLIGKRYAIKIMSPQAASNPELLTRFRREAEIVSRLGHEHIVEIHDFNFADGQAYMVMELLDGEDLAARMQSRGALPLEDIRRTVDQIAAALDVAHRAQIVHRDLKPQNLFLCRRGGRDDHVKVLDFGVSKILDAASAITQDNALLGTPFYMSPEQAEGRVSEIDARTDVFALGAIIWEMLSGRLAFAAPSFGVALYKVCCVDPPDVHLVRPDVPPALSMVLRRALAKDRHQRTPSVLDLAAELAAALHGAMPLGLPSPAHGGTAALELPGSASPSARSLPVASMAASAGASARGVPTVASMHAAASSVAPGVSNQAGYLASSVAPGVSNQAGYLASSVAPGVWQPAAPHGVVTSDPQQMVPWAGVRPSQQHSAMATGSVLVPPRPPRVRLAALLVAAVTVLAVGVWFVVAASSSADRTAASTPAPPSPAVPTPASSPAAPAPPAPADVALFFAVEPAQVAVEITLADHKVTGGMLRVPKSDKPLAITATARGYMTFHGEVVPSADQTVAIALKRINRRPAPTRTPPKPVAATEPETRAQPTAATAPGQHPQPAAASTRPQPAATASTPPATATPAAQSPRPAPTAPVPAASPQPGRSSAPFQTRPTPPPPPPPPPKKKTGTIFDQ